MLDNALLLTIIFIIVTTIIGTFLSGRKRDRCLTSFCGFMVTLLEKDGKRVWGNLAVETSGLELLYSEDYLDEDHIESSYILFKVGIFKEYGSQFLQVMDVSYPDGDETRLCDIIVPRAHASIRHGAEASHGK